MKIFDDSLYQFERFQKKLNFKRIKVIIFEKNRSSSTQVINKLTQNVFNSVSRMMSESDKKVYSLLLSTEVNHLNINQLK